VTAKPANRLAAVELDDSLGRGPSPEADHERNTAIYDLIEDNRFALASGVAGPYHLILSTQEGRLVLDVRSEAQQPIMVFGLSLTPFRRIVKDYFQICDSYYEAIKLGTPAQIETVDMARRGLHNEGSEILMERLKGKVETDMETARRLFTLICALVWRG
jgi:uncharacterized protein (UPF0262 family)